MNDSVSTAAPLAPYAAHDERSRGRRHPEPAPELRREFQRDRDRIIHSNAFRRLVYKTQVFVNHEGDLYRTRITHSIEVAQIARSAALALSLNEALTEAISLAHDLGHTPFGHAGQDALNECMRDYGGFEHNLQSLRVVDELEERYAEFRGLNLTFECREGILKHCSVRHARELGELGERFLTRQQPGLEAQIANLADEIAYNNHDVDDGLRAQLLTVEALRATRMFRRQHEAVIARYPDLSERRLVYKTQVFVNHEGDLYRTRITHSIEVAQIARSVAVALDVNEALSEAICLAHDLGHTPFGHAGQDALNECMRDYGGFEHNLQSLRVVDELEERYAEFRGLNLTFECREGILKHCSVRHA
ncbi:MAG TPA: deoxyguanosinetriphosphate triphosphohydrolase, partial [Steroidobacteraceae bacterium]|nr:deoxyguanosinetriphosphate triphosphohydrolase [Steroidobacteraceae bacterium]